MLGIAVGLLLPTVGAAVKPLNDWFIALVKMIVAPVIFVVVVHAVATMDNVRRVGKIGIKALSYFIAFSLLSMIIGLAVGNIFKPGEGMNIDPSTLDPSKIPGQNTETGFVHFVSGLIPETLLSAFTSGAILPALFISIVFGFALNMSGSKGKPIVDFVSALQVVIFRIVGWVMKLAPFGTFGALAAVVANYGASSLANLGMLILVFTGTCVVYIFADPVADHAGLQTQPVRADPLPEDRTDHRAGHRVQRSGPAAADAEDGEPRRQQARRRHHHPGRVLLQPGRLRDLPDDGLAVPGPGRRHRPVLAAATGAWSAS